MTELAHNNLNSQLILEIKGNSLDDGPGIRSVIFFKGCPLSCLWCHNPESKRMQAEIGHDASACIGCGSCIAACPLGALSVKNPFFIDRAQCDLCFDCVDLCPCRALRRIGVPMTVAQIVAAVLKDKPFFDTSGGGVTLSGGEPTYAIGFAAKLVKALKSEGIHVLLETCGAFSLQTFREQLYPFLDMVYFDLKLIDDEAHRHYCGISNRIILQNFKLLQQWACGGGVPILARVPLVPGITDTAENLQAVAAFLKQCGAGKVQLLPYHPLWHEKNRIIGQCVLSGADNKALRGWLSPEALAESQAIFIRQGIEV